MANTVLVQTKVVAMEVGAYNEKGVSTVNIQNGAPLVLGALSAVEGQNQLFTVTPTTGIVKNVWMAYSPEVNITESGALQMLGIDSDPRNFTNIAKRPLDIFKLAAGVDIIQVTLPFFAAGKDPATVTGATVVELNASGQFEAKTTPTASYAGLGFNILDNVPLTIASGILGGENVAAWKLMCTQN